MPHRPDASVCMLGRFMEGKIALDDEGAGWNDGRCPPRPCARPLYNEGEEISALDNDVDKWLHGGLDDGSMRYSETFHSLGAIASRFSCAKAMVY